MQADTWSSRSIVVVSHYDSLDSSKCEMTSRQMKRRQQSKLASFMNDKQRLVVVRKGVEEGMMISGDHSAQQHTHYRTAQLQEVSLYEYIHTICIMYQWIASCDILYT